MNRYLRFSPDLIVEATSVCDRSCKGCYAPNVVSKENISKFFRERPELFLSKESFRSSLEAIGIKLSVASIRGGEPSRHPELPSLFSILRETATTVYLETHGRWVLEDTEYARALIESCRANHVILKISFDSMHGLGDAALKAIVDRAEGVNIEYVIAITELDEKSFENTRASCSWISDSKIIFQKKEKISEDLIRPKIGVVHVDGNFSPTLSVKASFQKLNKEDKGIEASA